MIEPPPKRRRIASDGAEDDDYEVVKAAANVLKKPKPMAMAAFQRPSMRKPLDIIKNSSLSSQSQAPTDNGSDAYYTVLWYAFNPGSRVLADFSRRRFTMKKNKTWDGDGVLSVVGGYANLQDISGRELGRIACKGPLLVGSELSIGCKDIEVESMITKEDFLAGRPFLGITRRPPVPPSLKEMNDSSRESAKAQSKYERLAATQRERQHLQSSKKCSTSFKTPMLRDDVLKPNQNAIAPQPRHSTTRDGALVMKRPKSVPNGKQIVDVVVDPFLSDKLREHQRAGVAFLYECVMGMKGYDGEGAILADEMGLGKTLQTIALVWTLLKQNPIYHAEPVVKKALIVCPVTLIANWRKEFYKWLGKDKIGIFTASNDKKVRITDFTKGRAYSVMIIGYEKLLQVQGDLAKANIDIVIADEGHRLKTAQNKAAAAIKSLNTDRRIILSGTPIQNDLAEFHTMVDFVNPGLLKKYSIFKKEFETPIVKSRQPGASANEIEKGEARSQELASITAMFILRRTSDILAKYLPPKTEYVVFCTPTSAQVSVYRAIVGSPMVNAALGSAGMSFELINILKKVCNSPTLLLKRNDKGDQVTKPEFLEVIPPQLLRSPGASGKLQVLDSLLHCIKTTTEEKVVLVSNYTSTMDVLANLLSSLSYRYLRLDGSTPPAKRQELVDRFNRSPQSNSFVFLLSAKAGGVGLNLIGASRLVLFDLDWNPATDLQAMARIHREGQKRPCFIYRMITQGALDEKIFQRQVSKTGLADSIVDGKGSVSGFTREELRDLFNLDEGTGCQTHKLLACSCGGSGLLASMPESDADERNDLASLNGSDDSKPSNRKENNLEDDEIEVVRLDNDSDDEPILPPAKRCGWRTGNQVDWKADEADERRKAREFVDAAGKTKMLSLMEYAHLDASRARKTATDFGGETSELDALELSVEDGALLSVLKEEGSRVGFVFSRMSS